VTTLYTTSLAPLSYSTASVSHPISLSAANRLSRSKISVSSSSLESNLSTKFKMDGPELPATEDSHRSVYCTINVSATETCEITCHHQDIMERNDKSYVFEFIEIAELV
jgi:hypothetical protein